ncbi:MAG: nuclear transport factor 2 family protein [Acidobacteriota bacterium]|nr:nuclear transport factor 2 family protein [Acidobacteriota bacterium]
MLESTKKNSGPLDSFDIEAINANVAGDSGVVVVTYAAKGKAADGTGISGKYRISGNFVRDHGKWMLMSAHATRLPDDQ